MSSKLLIFIIIFIIYTFISLKYKDNFEILQMPSIKLQTSHLLEKQPIILTDPITDLLTFLHSKFINMYIYKNFNMNVKSCNNSKSQYLLLNILSDQATLLIKHPLLIYKQVQISLDQYQTIILPYGWSFELISGEAKSVNLETFITLLNIMRFFDNKTNDK